MRARVATGEPPEPPEAAWTALEAPAYRAGPASTCCRSGPSPATCASTSWSGSVRARTPLGDAAAAGELIPDRFEYRTGVTYVGSTVDDLLDAGAGVCQDFAHLVAAAAAPQRHRRPLRVRLPVRPPPGDDDADSAEVDTHAWVEALLPGDGGADEPVWVGADPTNRWLAGERHVKIGHGRHYSDVPPIKGVYRGPGGAET